MGDGRGGGAREGEKTKVEIEEKTKVERWGKDKGGEMGKRRKESVK